MPQLSDSQLVVLTAACQRPDRYVFPITAKLKGNAAGNVLKSLLNKGLIKEVRAKRDDTVWRTARTDVIARLGELSGAWSRQARSGGCRVAPGCVSDGRAPTFRASTGSAGTIFAAIGLPGACVGGRCATGAEYEWGKASVRVALRSISVGILHGCTCQPDDIRDRDSGDHRSRAARKPLAK